MTSTNIILDHLNSVRFGIKKDLSLLLSLHFLNFIGVFQSFNGSLMKNSIYFTVMLGVILLVIHFISLFLELGYSDLFLIIGLGILLVITLPLFYLDRSRYTKQKKQIIKSFQQEKGNLKRKKAKKAETPKYPSFRQQKSGLTWGGGNIHGSGAKRGSKRGFLNH